jgi:hypothetical protein
MFIDCTALFSDLDPDKMSPELLDKIANRMIEQALGSQAAVEEVNRRLAAGETVTLEAVCQAVNEPTRTTLEPEEKSKP